MSTRRPPAPRGDRRGPLGARRGAAGARRLTFINRLVNNLPGDATATTEERHGDHGDGRNGDGEFEVSDDLSALDVLLDGDIDKVMANLDRIVEAAPSYAS